MCNKAQLECTVVFVAVVVRSTSHCPGTQRWAASRCSALILTKLNRNLPTVHQQETALLTLTTRDKKKKLLYLSARPAFVYIFDLILICCTPISLCHILTVFCPLQTVLCLCHRNFFFWVWKTYIELINLKKVLVRIMQWTEKRALDSDFFNSKWCLLCAAALTSVL